LKKRKGGHEQTSLFDETKPPFSFPGLRRKKRTILMKEGTKTPARPREVRKASSAERHPMHTSILAPQFRWRIYHCAHNERKSKIRKNDQNNRRVTARDELMHKRVPSGTEKRRKRTRDER